MVGSPAKRALLPQRGTIVGGGDAVVNAQLRAISLEYPHAELTAATMGWHSSRKLGTGCYGAVYRGELKDGSEVAIKAIDLGALMGKGESPEDAGFDEEVQMLSKFRHPNLVTLLGWGQQGLQRYLVYEFLAGGDVFQRLHKSRVRNTDKLFVWHERLSVCLDAATGLSHMHNSTPKAFHRDIKSANILLDRHGTAKMADFGLSCTSGQTGALHITVKTISGTPGYKCPIYERTGRFTEGSEVYSFGMVLLEVLTGLDPSSADPHLPGGIIYPVADTIAPSQPGAVERCLRSLDVSAAWPTQLAHEFGVLALRCVATRDERSRPHFVEIVRSVRSMMERFPPSATASPPAAAPEKTPKAVDAGSTPKNFGRAKTFPAAKEAAPPAVAASAAPRGVSLAVKAAPGCAAVSSEQSQDGPFQLEVVMATGLDVESLAPELRRMPVAPCAASGDSPRATLTAPVGRHHQPEFFEAWLPDLTHRSCISRKAFEVSWSPGSDSVWLVACGTNPMSVDGKVATKNTRMLLRLGSEVCFTYELKVLLRLRCVPVVTPSAPTPVAAASPQATPMLAGASLGAVPAAAGGASVVAAAAPGGASLPGQAPAEDRAQPARIEIREAPVLPLGQPTPWSVDRTCRLAGEGVGERLHGRATVLEGVASVGDAVERLNSGSLQSPGGFCVVYSATKGAHFLLYQPGFREAAMASLGVSEEILEPGSQEQSPQYRQTRAVAPPQLDAAKLPEAATGHAVVRMESAPQEGASASTTARSGSTGSCTSASGAAMAWRLVCIHAEGLPQEDLAALPADLREFPAAEGTTQVGRHHQPQHFEAWLPDPILRFCISRTHLDLTASGRSLVLVNRSSNLLCVDRERAPKGEPRTLGVGQTVSFARQEGQSLVHFLVLQVRGSEVAAVEDGGVQLPRPLLAQQPQGEAVLAAAKSPCQLASRESAPDVPAACGGAPTAAVVRCRSPEKPGRGSVGHVAVLAAGGTPTPVRRPRGSAGPATLEDAGRLSLSPSRVRPAAAAAAAAKAGAPPPVVTLELLGEGVLDVPASRRTIGPVSLGERPLLVGRRHQPDLHECAVSEKYLDFLSRDHFCVAYEGCEFWLLAMTSNRIWRDRDGEAPVQLARDDLVTLLPGDRIALGTGSDVFSAELACKRLCWHFRKVEDGAVATPAAAKCASPQRATDSPPRWLAAATCQSSPLAGNLDQTARDPAPQC